MPLAFPNGRLVLTILEGYYTDQLSQRYTFISNSARRKHYIVAILQLIQWLPFDRRHLLNRAQRSMQGSKSPPACL
jgi:hypothetical protein